MNDGMLGGVGNECIPKPPLPPFRMGKWLGRIPLVFLAVFLLRHAAKRLSKHVPFVTDAVYATCPDKVKPTAKMARIQAKHPLCSPQYQRNTLPDATGSLIRASNRQDGYSIVRTNPRASEGQDSWVSAWSEIVSQICCSLPIMLIQFYFVVSVGGLVTKSVS